MGGIPHDSELLRSAYAACDTFLLASWLETPGLAALEACLAGAKIVITQEGATREYFRNLAAYVNPSNCRDIRSKTLTVYEQPKDDRLREHVRRNFLWDFTASRTLLAYQQSSIRPHRSSEASGPTNA